MNTNHSLVLAAFAAAFTLGGCTSAGSGSAALPALAPAAIAATQSVAPATFSTVDRHDSASRVVALPTLIVVANTPTVSFSEAGTFVLACAVQITSTDPDGDYMVVAYATPAGFPVENAPTPSALALAVPDLSSNSKTLANTGFPGNPVWQGVRKDTQTHCIDVTITVPTGQASGTYATTMQYALLEKINHSLYATRVTQSSSLTTTVAGAFVR